MPSSQRKSYPIPFSSPSGKDSPPSSSLVLTAPLHWPLFIFPSLPHSSLRSYLTTLTPHPSSLSRVSTLYPTIVFYLFSSLLPVPALWPFLSHLSLVGSPYCSCSPTQNTFSQSHTDIVGCMRYPFPKPPNLTRYPIPCVHYILFIRSLER